MKLTPLDSCHDSLTAKMVDFAGWRMPVQYGSIIDEVRCVRSSVGLFDLSHMGRLVVRGADHIAFLDQLATNFVAKIPVGAIRYSLFCHADGFPIDDLLIYRDEDQVFLVVNASNTTAVVDWLEEHRASFDVTIEDQTEAVAMIALQGPRSVDVLQPLCEGLDLSTVRYYRSGFGTLCGIEGQRVSRTGYTGEDGFEVYVPQAEAVRVWEALLESGKDKGLRPIGLAARDTLRLEAGMPLYGHEIDLEHDPIEAGLTFGIRFNEEKGDWIGRAALAARKEQPTRKLVGLVTDGPRVPRQGYPLVVGDREIGHVCSGAVSPTLETKIATAYVPIDMDENAVVQLDVRGKRQDCRLHSLPFYSRKS